MKLKSRNSLCIKQELFHLFNYTQHTPRQLRFHHHGITSPRRSHVVFTRLIKLAPSRCRQLQDIPQRLTGKVLKCLCP